MLKYHKTIPISHAILWFPKKIDVTKKNTFTFNVSPKNEIASHASSPNQFDVNPIEPYFADHVTNEAVLSLISRSLEYLEFLFCLKSNNIDKYPQK